MYGKLDIGERIKQLRVKAEMSTRALAECLEVSATAISKYERNIITPSSDVLLRMAKLFKVKTAYFFESFADINLTGLKYRKRREFSEKRKEFVEEIIRDEISSFIEVKSFFNEERFVQADILNMRRKVDSFIDAEELANEVRNQFKIGYDAIPNLVDLLEDKGVIVVFVKSEVAGFDGLSGYANDIPFVCVNEHVDGDRLRFSLAHEFGHLLLLGDYEDKVEEAYANRFAGAFLFPRVAVHNELGRSRKQVSLYELDILKHEYLISMQAILHRLHDLEVISDYEYKRIMMQISKLGYRTNEPNKINKESSNKLVRLVCEAVSEEYITASRGAQYLKLNTEEFYEKYYTEGLSYANYH